VAVKMNWNYSALRHSEATLQFSAKSHFLECPLWVISRLFCNMPVMSAIGGKADAFYQLSKRPLIAKSGYT